eukprot:6370776-Amphidinium_carterae.1
MKAEKVTFIKPAASAGLSFLGDTFRTTWRSLETAAVTDKVTHVIARRVCRGMQCWHMRPSMGLTCNNSCPIATQLASEWACPMSWVTRELHICTQFALGLADEQDIR